MDLNVISKTETGKGVSRKYRQKGFVPAVMYGNKKESKAFVVDGKTLSKYIVKNGTSRMLTLSVEGSEQKHVVLFKEIDRDSLTGVPMHVDFFEVDQNKAVERTVALKFEGVPVGVSNQGGMLSILRHEIEISCLPQDIPEHALVINVEKLELNSNLFVSSIELPKGLEIITPKDTPIAQVNLPKEEVKVEAVEAEEGAEGAEGAAAEKQAGETSKTPAETKETPSEKK